MYLVNVSYAHGKKKVTDIGTWRSRFCRICRQPSGTEKQGQKKGQKKREKQVQKKGQVITEAGEAGPEEAGPQA